MSYTRTVGSNQPITLHYLTLNDVITVAADDTAPSNPYSTGYGAAVPTRYRLRCAVGESPTPRWRRVYVAIHSNSGSPYVKGTVDGKRTRFYLDTAAEAAVTDADERN